LSDVSQTQEVNLNENMAKSKIHRYYKNVDCSRQIISQKIHFNNSGSGHTDKTRQAGMLMCLLYVPIFYLLPLVKLTLTTIQVVLTVD
jgi:hypothetical protein